MSDDLIKFRQKGLHSSRPDDNPAKDNEENATSDLDIEYEGEHPQRVRALWTRGSCCLPVDTQQTAVKILEMFAEGSLASQILALLASTGCKFEELYDLRISFVPFQSEETQEVVFGNSQKITIGTMKQLKGLEKHNHLLLQKGVYHNSVPRVRRFQNQQCEYTPAELVKPTLFLNAKTVCTIVQQIRQHPKPDMTSLLDTMNAYFPAVHSYAKMNPESGKWSLTFLRKVYAHIVARLFAPVIYEFSGKSMDKTIIIQSVLNLASVSDAVWYNVALSFKTTDWIISRERQDMRKMYKRFADHNEDSHSDSILSPGEECHSKMIANENKSESEPKLHCDREWGDGETQFVTTAIEDLGAGHAVLTVHVNNSEGTKPEIVKLHVQYEELNETKTEIGFPESVYVTVGADRSGSLTYICADFLPKPNGDFELWISEAHNYVS
jgi:hypothetical protein